MFGHKIILDDGTETMNDLVPKDPLIKYIKMDCDGNRLPIGCKRNKAIEYASNEYIIYLNSGDIFFKKNSLRELYENIRGGLKGLVDFYGNTKTHDLNFHDNRRRHSS